VPELKSHLQYLSYVLRHKWFVFVAGRRTNEWTAYVKTFYTDEDGSYVREQFDRAWLHHQHKNPHHWQHWILRKDDGDVIPLEMPPAYVLEMVADWMGAGRTITGKWEVGGWYEKNRSKIILHPVTRARVEGLLKALA
jgi:hypothetical protein